MCHKAGAPKHTNFRCPVKGNSIENCPVTSEDTNIMKKIQGKDIAHSKGKVVRRTPRKVVSNNVTVSDELKEKNTKIFHMWTHSTSTR